MARRSPAGPSTGVPSQSVLEASMRTPPSVVRQRPIPSKFSRARPIGSIELVAAGARGVGPVLLHALAHRERAARLLVERRHVGRRRGRRRAEDVRQHVLAARDRRRPVPVRVERQHAALAEQPAAVVVLDAHAAILIAVDVRHAVVPRQPLVQERVVRVEQIQDAPVLDHDALEEHLRFALQRLPQVVVEVREDVLVRVAGSSGCADTATGRRSSLPSARARSSASIRFTC